MGAVTYPDPRVARFIDENFIPIQIDVSKDTPEVHEAIERYRQMWTPTIIVLDPEGQEIRRSQGYFPPDDFLPELRLGMGLARMYDKQYGLAFEQFQKVVSEHGGTKPEAEAMYWSGVAAYKRDNEASGLTEHWSRLKERFPDSPWWTKASFIDSPA